MAETAGTCQAVPAQPTPGAAPAYKLAPVFLEKEKPVCPPFQPGDRSWGEDWCTCPFARPLICGRRADAVLRGLAAAAWDFEADEADDGEDRISSLPTGILMMVCPLMPHEILECRR